MGIFSSAALQEEHVLITGATGGIGRATAITVLKMGASVTVTGRNRKKLTELEQELSSYATKDRICVVAADILKAEERDVLVGQASSRNGVITCLVNAAGISGGDTVDRLTPKDLQEIMEVNYTATVLLTQQIYQGMIQSQKGAIVNVSSLSGLRGTYGNSAYSASKFALIGFTQSLALEAIESNIRVNAVCPGYVETEMAKNAINKKALRNDRSFQEEYELAKDGIPSGKITNPEEVANTIAFLLTDAAVNIVGESVKISGENVMR
ncbi:SDR family NAD(P)-dependent oxidoreductase [Pseudalkalibacillus caeni]|uniref:SDR family oxidoreductase n=1 Tax=Exobacillus caeni TaxID=2574798 RepID=A0A5R9FA66_9BACL|nr:SDR family oxidoreductase [Pseudalkalibacillus caeni]TLS37454.1 SDR family oxidoreductase [Pseudalkalibacillus caeni]